MIRVHAWIVHPCSPADPAAVGLPLLQEHEWEVQGLLDPEHAFFLPPVRRVYEPGPTLLRPNDVGVRWARGRKGSTGEGVGLVAWPGGLVFLWRELRIEAPDLPEVVRQLEAATMVDADLSPTGRALDATAHRLGLEPFLYGRRRLVLVAAEATRATVPDDALWSALFALTDLSVDRGAPSPRGWELLLQEQAFDRWTEWKALSHRDNLAVLLRPGRKSPAAMVQHDLFPLVLLELYRKLRLVQLMSATSSHADAVDPEREVARYAELHATYVGFRNRFCFAEVTRNTSGRWLRPTLERAMGIPPLLREVEDELAQAHATMEALVQQRRERARRAAEALATWALPLALVTGIFGMNVWPLDAFGTDGGPPLALGWMIAGGLSSAGVLLAWVSTRSR